MTFATEARYEPFKIAGLFTSRRRVDAKVMTFNALAKLLEESDGIGPPDYVDEGMIQYLRTERIIPPYQTRGYKLVELVRIYEAKTTKHHDRHEDAKTRCELIGAELCVAELKASRVQACRPSCLREAD